MSKISFQGKAGDFIMDKLEASDVEGEAPILTIKEARFVKSGNEEKLRIVWEEYPAKGMVCNATQMRSFEKLMNAGILSDQADNDGNFLWVGVKIPLMRQENEYVVKKGEPRAGEVVTAIKLYACHPSDYAKLLGTEPKNTTRRVGGKK